MNSGLGGLLQFLDVECQEMPGNDKLATHQQLYEAIRDEDHILGERVAMVQRVVYELHTMLGEQKEQLSLQECINGVNQRLDDAGLEGFK